MGNCCAPPTAKISEAEYGPSIEERMRRQQNTPGSNNDGTPTGDANNNNTTTPASFRDGAPESFEEEARRLRREKAQQASSGRTHRSNSTSHQNGHTLDTSSTTTTGTNQSALGRQTASSFHGRPQLMNSATPGLGGINGNVIPMYGPLNSNNNNNPSLNSNNGAGNEPRHSHSLVNNNNNNNIPTAQSMNGIMMVNASPVYVDENGNVVRAESRQDSFFTSPAGPLGADDQSSMMMMMMSPGRENSGVNANSLMKKNLQASIPTGFRSSSQIPGATAGQAGAMRLNMALQQQQNQIMGRMGSNVWAQSYEVPPNNNNNNNNNQNITGAVRVPGNPAASFMQFERKQLTPLELKTLPRDQNRTAIWICKHDPVYIREQQKIRPFAGNPNPNGNLMSPHQQQHLPGGSPQPPRASQMLLPNGSMIAFPNSGQSALQQQQQQQQMLLQQQRFPSMKLMFASNEHFPVPVNTGNNASNNNNLRSGASNPFTNNNNNNHTNSNPNVLALPPFPCLPPPQQQQQQQRSPSSQDSGSPHLLVVRKQKADIVLGASAVSPGSNATIRDHNQTSLNKNNSDASSRNANAHNTSNLHAASNNLDFLLPSTPLSPQRPPNQNTHTVKDSAYAGQAYAEVPSGDFNNNNNNNNQHQNRRSVGVVDQDLRQDSSSREVSSQQYQLPGDAHLQTNTLKDINTPNDSEAIRGRKDFIVVSAPANDAQYQQSVRGIDTMQLSKFQNTRRPQADSNNAEGENDRATMSDLRVGPAARDHTGVIGGGNGAPMLIMRNNNNNNNTNKNNNNNTNSDLQNHDHDDDYEARLLQTGGKPDLSRQSCAVPQSIENTKMPGNYNHNNYASTNTNAQIPAVVVQQHLLPSPGKVETSSSYNLNDTNVMNKNKNNNNNTYDRNFSRSEEAPNIGRVSPTLGNHNAAKTTPPVTFDAINVESFGNTVTITNNIQNNNNNNITPPSSHSATSQIANNNNNNTANVLNGFSSESHAAVEKNMKSSYVVNNEQLLQQLGVVNNNNTNNINTNAALLGGVIPSGAQSIGSAANARGSFSNNYIHNNNNNNNNPNNQNTDNSLASNLPSHHLGNNNNNNINQQQQVGGAFTSHGSQYTTGAGGLMAVSGANLLSPHHNGLNYVMNHNTQSNTTFSHTNGRASGIQDGDFFVPPSAMAASGASIGGGGGGQHGAVTASFFNNNFHCSGTHNASFNYGNNNNNNSNHVVSRQDLFAFSRPSLMDVVSIEKHNIETVQNNPMALALAPDYY